MNASEDIKTSWRICYDGEINDQNGKFICGFRWNSYKEFNEGNNAANARLIAAAPDLLDCLETVFKYLDLRGFGSTESEINLGHLIQMNIMKANGES